MTFKDKIKILVIVLGVSYWWVEYAYCQDSTEPTTEDVRDKRGSGDGGPYTPAPAPYIPPNVVVIDGEATDAMKFTKGIVTKRIWAEDGDEVSIESPLTTTNNNPLVVNAPLHASGIVKSQGQDVIHVGHANLPYGYPQLDENGQIDVSTVPSINVFFSGAHATE